MAKRVSVIDVHARKGGEPIAVLTAYTAPVARLLDPHVDILLVGDSVGMVVYGMENTRGVTPDMMIAQGRAVVNASQRALVVIDMPYGSYESSKEQALASAQRIVEETGAQAVKLEGGVDRADIVRHLAASGIPVMGHVGLLPQRVREKGGYRYQGRTEEDEARILADAQAVEKAGAFSLVIEAVQEDAARRITGAVGIPTIGIGASPACDGQVLVVDDMLGMGGYMPSFVKPYASLAPIIEEAAKRYAEEVRSRAFPSAEYFFTGAKKKNPESV